MADDLTPSAPAAPSASSEAASSSPGASSESGAQDTHAIAASVFADSETPSAASPAAPTPSDPPPPAGATTSGEDDADYQNLLASGHMPVDRHKAVLTNARNKTRAEVEREYQAKYSWADQLDRQRVQYALDIFEGLDKNADATIRVLAQARGVNLTPPEPKAPDGPPPPDVRLESGQEFYEAKRLSELLAWKDAQYDQKLAALEARYQPLIRERHWNALKAEADSEAGVTLAECRTQWPRFADLEDDIKARMVASDKLAAQRNNPALSISLERAYIQAFAAKGLPAIESAHATDRASQLQRKAAASSTPPGAPRPVTPLKYAERTTADIAREVFSRSA